MSDYYLYQSSHTDFHVEETNSTFRLVGEMSHGCESQLVTTAVMTPDEIAAIGIRLLMLADLHGSRHPLVVATRSHVQPPLIRKK